MKAIIVAAGRGVRLSDHSERIPKTLLPYGEETILSQILANFAAIGVSDFVVVVGYREQLIRNYLQSRGNFGHSIRIVRNPDWEQGNGVSVHSAREAVGEDDQVLLSMSDHLVDPVALGKIRDAVSTSNLLLTDFRLREVFDPDDATKVVVDGDRIHFIGKELTEYNAVDCGIFRITPLFFDALARQIERGLDSISDGARLLIQADELRSVPIPDDSFWIDIDTPESYRHALASRGRFQPLPRAASIGLSKPSS